MNRSVSKIIDLNSQQLNEICKILSEHVPELDVWAFGSRVNGNSRKYSDLDIVLITTESLPFSIKADLVECFLESDLPFKVDIVDWSSTSDAFRKIIEIEKVVLQEGTRKV